jgi:hypothetical protein
MKVKDTSAKNQVYISTNSALNDKSSANAGNKAGKPTLAVVATACCNSIAKMARRRSDI